MTYVDCTMPNSLADVLTDAAKRYGGKRALVTGERDFTFEELDALASRVANGLTSLGVEPGDRVTIYGANSWQWVISYYGILKTGAVVNPINVMLTPEEVRYVVRDCGAKALIASREKGLPLLGDEQHGELPQLILYGAELPSSVTSFDALLEASSDRFQPPTITTDALSTICYTSGTTGTPKGAMLSHRAVLMNMAMTALMHGRTAKDVVVTALPCPHVYGNVVMNSTLQVGATLVLLPLFKEQAVLDAIQGYRATMLEGVPTMYLYLLGHPSTAQTDFSSLRLCTVGGQTMPTAKMQEVEAALGCPLVELWGMTELAGLGTTFAWNGPRKPGSIGVALPYLRARIVDAMDASLELKEGNVGELVIKGPAVMTGYFGDTQATKEAIDEDGWLHTGDLAKIDSDGYVFVIDRKKDMIITSGYNIYPAELERVIAAHPGVAMVAVGSVKDEIKGELAKAYVVAKQGADTTADDILSHCRAQLAAYKVPRAVQFVPDLPKTSSGKVMRRKLHELDALTG
ncbi:long-chain acyl-CoA synthetase [Variovorax sp. YR266]|uniref:class I adenylate-forming enzyme family protein n=1 Tax=Variovorax sp. YR266 TaxID=1884386 RepID=UPI00089AD635|nr:long-chain-fatty-acid--CoA ligase [Variovorax sp. YR266]SDZ70810.1 long-chain acyl-CoA synthetase [Variovorax sp. YR266]